MFVLENGAKKKGEDPRLQAISQAIRVVPHFPKQGIMFQDITTLLLDHSAFKDVVDIFVDRYRDMDISVVAGEVISEKYVLEYGTDCLEMHVGAVQHNERVIIIDDLVATERADAEVVECACVIGLSDLKSKFFTKNNKTDKGTQQT
ncbi:hypothetical protein GLYMA_14G115700v4 [Glycine max]|nr:hypothetical protein GLYMA_14G115700v4 [Glycine max]KAH1094146.1 hypothetical protein GYH30_039744 [Glycine max]